MNKLEVIKYLDNERNKYKEAYDKLQPQDIMRVSLGMRLRDLESALARLTGTEVITLNGRDDHKEIKDFLKDTAGIKVVGDKYYIKGGDNES